MNIIKSIFKSRKTEDTNRIASFDQPFAIPRTQRIVFPPKPVGLSGKSIAPRQACKPIQQGSGDISCILFGAPLESVKTSDSISTGVRYPTSALFPK
jgi:hypothetical protein